MGVIFESPGGGNADEAENGQTNRSYIRTDNPLIGKLEARKGREKATSNKPEATGIAVGEAVTESKETERGDRSEN